MLLLFLCNKLRTARNVLRPLFVRQLARNANATYKVGKMVLVNTQIIDKYLETCRVIEN